jgi:WD40 repeat protein
MADSAARAQRATALEEKRRRLEDLKKRREVRSQDTARVHASATANLDEYIDGLLKEPDTGAVDSKDPLNVVKSSAEVDSEILRNGDSNPSPAAVDPIDTGGEPTATPVPVPVPKLVETFTVATQTDDYEYLAGEEAQEDDDRIEHTDVVDKVATITLNDEERDPKLLTLPEIEKEVISQPFSSFINTASKKMERMLGTPLLSDLLVDFVGDNDAKSGSLLDATKDSNDKFLQSHQIYECSNWTSGRDVTDMDWSPLHRELLLSTYHMCMSTNSIAPNKGQTAISAVAPNDTLSSSLTPRSGELQSDGLALIWSLNMPNRPEHIVTCGSPVTAGRFHPGNATLVIGGCESGQIVVWDLRSGRLPVQKSALTTVTGAPTKGHTHPIGSMEVIEGGVSNCLYCMVTFFVRTAGSSLTRYDFVPIVGTVWIGNYFYGRTC